MKFAVAIFSISFALTSFYAPRSSQEPAGDAPKKLNYCEIVGAARSYDKAVVQTTVILDETNGAPDLYGADCPPIASRDNRAQAVFPARWESSPEGKKLKEILHRKHKAAIEIVATLKAIGGPFGSSVAPFRLTITRIISVNEVRKSGRT